MKTTEYPWFRPDFREYNVAQAAVVPFCDNDCNMVVSFNTGVGKSVLGECCFAYHMRNGGKCAYVAPSRSLCSEQYTKWSTDAHFKDSGVAIRTRERQSNDDFLHSAGLTVMTGESFDVRTRHPVKWSRWLSELECLVIDEAHMIGDPSRGAALETSLMRLARRNSSCRIVMLSATMDNASELAKWVKSLNNKQTKCFVSSWRPNEVEVNEHAVDDKVKKVIELVRSGSGKTIVFVHSKRVGRDIMKRLKKEGISTAFHNASASKGIRKKMESKFDDPFSGLDVIISTSTLGAGVNIG